MKNFSGCDIYVYFVNYCLEPTKTFIGHRQAVATAGCIYLSVLLLCRYLRKCYVHDFAYG